MSTSDKPTYLPVYSKQERTSPNDKHGTEPNAFNQMEQMTSDMTARWFLASQFR